MEENSNQHLKLPFTLPNQISDVESSATKKESLLPQNVFLRPSALISGGLPMGSLKGPMEGLGGGLKGPMGGAGIGGLKKAAPKVRFINQILDNKLEWKMSATNRMRSIDAIKMYKPLEDECLDLNIPDDRLEIHLTKNILLLCGGCVGVRFSSEEMDKILKFSENLDPKFNDVQKSFDLLSNIMKKRILQGGPYENKNESEINIIHEDDIDAPEVIKFQQCADIYLNLIIELQQLILEKQKFIPKRDGNEIRELPKFDKDPDGNIGNAQPEWLTLIIDKYKSTNNTTEKPTIGKLSCFISCFVMGQLQCSITVKQAIGELLVASNDTQATYTSGVQMDVNFLGPDSQKYWAKRIFVFLVKLKELKSSIKDEKSLYNFEIFQSF